MVEGKKIKTGEYNKREKGPAGRVVTGLGPRPILHHPSAFWFAGPIIIAPMSALGHRLHNLFQRRSIGRYGHIQEVQGVPFYEARQPWWARFTWGFIAADLLVT